MTQVLTALFLVHSHSLTNHKSSQLHHANSHLLKKSKEGVCVDDDDDSSDSEMKEESGVETESSENNESREVDDEHQDGGSAHAALDLLADLASGELV